ncbi:MAG: multidrug ABC transporter ATP-binding protein [Halobacteriovoraceae bacterium]|nr:multidrug ABC transporter ATP-binding protein [Halobacteriovoraceae bacterium]|tara:strand:+ start:23189 stop:24181 length:993 start_codon:yes stop_codon:yes gene_type:complete
MIEVQSLSKHFKVHQKEAGLKGSLRSLFNRKYLIKPALKDLDLTVPTGEIIGLIGANGAGKTTLTKILSGIIHPTAGDVMINGYRPWQRENDYRRQMAVIMGQKAQLWWDLPALDGFLLLKDIYQIPTQSFRTNIDYLAEYLGIKDQLKIQVRRLSLGERMKVELMAALLHSPKVIFLDEPTIGLDITAQKAVRKFLKQYQKDHNPTMVLTSHYMDDIEELCKRIVILRQGEKVFDGPIAKVHEQYSLQKMITAHVNSVKRLKELEQTFPHHLGEFSVEDNVIKVITSKEQTMEVARYLFEHIELLDFSITNENIGDLIEKIMLHGESFQ